jgi:hypothetical protein
MLLQKNTEKVLKKQTENFMSVRKYDFFPPLENKF